MLLTLNRQVDELNRKEDQEITSCNYSHLGLHDAAKIYLGEKTDS